MKPSLAVLAASDGPGRVVVGTPPGCSWCAGWGHSAVAVAVVAVVAAAAAGVFVAYIVAVDDGVGDADAGDAVGVACSSES